MSVDASQLEQSNDALDATAYWLQQQQQQLALLQRISANTAPKPEQETAAFEVDLGTAPNGGELIQGGVKLPRSSAIRFIYCENYGAAASVNIVVGTDQVGRVLATVKKGTFKCFPVPDGIKSVSIVSSGVDVGLIRIALTTDIWAPQQGATV